MAQRPNFIDLRSHSSMSTQCRPLKSPRLHVPGEAPPELSPLDAFAMQSRLLARQLHDSNRDGKRMSRLPPLTAESPVIIQGRSDYFRSFSHETDREVEDEGMGLGLKMETDKAENRPTSVHVRMSRVPEATSEASATSRISLEQKGGRLEQVAEENGYFGIGQRTGSPEPMENDSSSTTRQPPIGLDNRAIQVSPAPSYIDSNGELNQKATFDISLAPPRPFFPVRSRSAMSQLSEYDVDDQMSQSLHSLPSHKMSGSNAFSTHSPVPQRYQRSPSISSDMSATLPRPSLNFSRPLSRPGTPGPETPSRQASADSAPSFLFAYDSAYTPASINSDRFIDAVTDNSGAAPSYVYSKFILPRGKILQRTAPLYGETSQSPSYFDSGAALPPLPSTAMLPGRPASPSPPTRPSSAHTQAGCENYNIVRSSSERNLFSHMPVFQHSLDPTRSSTDISRASEEVPRGRSVTSQGAVNFVRSSSRTPLSTTTEIVSTAKNSTKFSLASAIEISGEEHLQKGIELHENGSLKESTYHLRHAARQKNPKGMLLYALACRHGWGMRPNQQEGVEWLRRAAECASIEIADDEGHAKEGKKIDAVERRTHKAQFALSIYELGVSHMNGWGVEQDKSLALRCFEIAGCECFPYLFFFSLYSMYLCD